MDIRALFGRHTAADPSGCLLWVGSRTHLGYGSFKFNDRTACAHRVAWMLARGPIPVDLEVDHLCRNRACVNVEHMELVSHAVNMHRGNAPAGLNKRKTHCLRGHAFDAENTRIETQKNGLERRQCRACVVLRKTEAQGVA